MQRELEKYQSKTTVEFILEQFQDMLLTGRLKPGDLLPSESQLCELFGVSRGSVREAMKILSAFGVVEIKRGNGTFIAENMGNSIMDPLLISLMMDSKDQEAMAEFREEIEKTVVRLAVKKRNDSDLERLHQPILEMKRLLDQDASNEAIRLRWVKADLDFHTALGEACHNPLMKKLYAFVMRFFEKMVDKTYQDAGNGAIALPLHEAIYLAIEAGDKEGADAAVIVSIDTWEERYFAKGESYDR